MLVLLKSVFKALGLQDRVHDGDHDVEAHEVHLKMPFAAPNVQVGAVV